MIKPKKTLGQNFLRDPKILSKIANFAEIGKEDVVLEIGPGEGLLTEILLERANKVIVVEKDESLAEKLNEKFTNAISSGNLQIIIGDVLEIEVGQDSRFKILDSGYKLIGNIPYYITGAIFKKFLEEVENKPKSITFVIQKEVADRIMAKDGKESILSISVKAYGEPKYGGIIKAGSFFPKPKVDSGLISIKNIKARSESFFSVQEKFFEILKTGFSHKRKFLISNLAPISAEKKLPEIFKKCGINEKARAENLKVEDWLCLTEKFLTS